MVPSPSEFASEWNEAEKAHSPSIRGELVVFTPKQVDRISSQDRTFLIEAGLPSSAAPFLTFRPLKEEQQKGGMLDHSGQLERHVEIGFDGSGNPICVELSPPHEVVLLDHDNGFERQVVNTSVARLAACLLAYRKLPNDADLARVEQLAGDLQVIDPEPWATQGFWWWEIEVLRVDVPT